MQMYKHLLDKLSSYSSPRGGPLLDDGIACWANDLGHGYAHSHDNTPWIVAGAIAGVSMVVSAAPAQPGPQRGSRAGVEALTIRES